MPYTRKDRILPMLQKNVSNFLEKEGEPGLLITVTKMTISKDFKYSTIYISIFPEQKEGEIFNSLEKKKKDLQNFVKIHTRLKTLPFFEIKIDEGEKNRQKIDAMSQDSKLE